MKAVTVEQWKFYLGDEKNSWMKDYDDQAWTSVNVPHDWSVEQPFTREASSGTGYLPGGIGWYRGRVSLTAIRDYPTIRLIFEGVYKNAQVWVNGYHVGSRPSGYATFSFELNELISYALDDELVIAVRVDHTDISDARWYNGSGITRPVRIECHKACQIVEYGTFFETKKIEGDQATIAISHTIKNNSENPIEVTVTEELRAVDAKLKATFSQTIFLKEQEEKQVIFDEKLTGFSLWSDEHPHLNFLKTTLTNQTTKETSDYEALVGLRTFSFCPETGFTINGENKKLRGVCLHEDAGCFGVAVPSVVWLRRLMKLKEMGTNAIRMAHNPHSQSLYRLCDILGFYVIDEAFDEWENAKNKWWQGHNVYPPKHEGYAEFFPNWHQADLENMIDVNKNHPSIIAWSIGNEIDYPNDPYANPLFAEMTGNNDASKPAEERIYNPNRPDTKRLSTIAHRLTEMAKKKDPTRPITLAAAFPELSSQTGLLDSLDLIGYNYKEHLYEKDHLCFPNQPLIGSENGHGYQEWLAVKENNYISGQFLWTGIDYLGEAHGWPIHGSGAGLLTLAGFEKENYYLRQSWWRKELSAYLVTRLANSLDNPYGGYERKWDYVPETPIEVFCFSNGERAVLSNGGKEWPMTYDDKVGYFKAVIPATTATLKVTVTRNGEEVTDELEVKTSASYFEITNWQVGKEQQTLLESFPTVIENDLYQLEIELKDRFGKRAVNDLNVTVLVEDGLLLGLENGDLSDITDYTENKRSTYQGRLICYVKGSGETKIKIMSNNLLQKNFSLSELM